MLLGFLEISMRAAVEGGQLGCPDYLAPSVFPHLPTRTNPPTNALDCSCAIDGNPQPSPHIVNRLTSSTIISRASQKLTMARHQIPRENRM